MENSRIESTLKNEEVRYDMARLEKAVQYLTELITHYNSEEADKFIKEFGFDMLSWLGELFEYWAKDKDIQYHAGSIFDTKKDKQSAQTKLFFTDLMKAGVVYGVDEDKQFCPYWKPTRW